MKLFATLFFVLLFTGGAVAQSCNALRSQLASAQAGQPNQRVVAALTRKARAYGCNKGSRSGRHSRCDSIAAQLAQARAGVVNRRRVQRLRNQIATHCNGGGTRQARRGTRQSTKGDRNIFSALFGGLRRDERDDNRSVREASVDPRARTRAVERSARDGGSSRSSAERAPRGSGRPLATRSSGRQKGSTRVGNSRTICVRLCDGFYFPINSRSHSDNYYDELAMCVGRCPGADVSLYVHNNGEPVERMRSTMTGEPYVDLPTAFQYRKALSPGCGCANGTRIVRGGDTSAPMTVASAGAAASGVATDSGTGSGKDQSRWVPFRAVYDGTGEPLAPSSTAHGAVAGTDTATAGAAGSRDDAASDRGSVATAAAGDTARDAAATVAFDPATSGVREVGPQHYTRAVAAFADAKDRPRRSRGARVPTAITVTPLRGDAVGERAEVPEVPRDDLTDEPIAPGTSAMVSPSSATVTSADPAGTGG